MHTDANVERVFAGVLDHVLVAAHAGGLEGARGELLLLVGHKVRHERKKIHAGLLRAAVKDADLRVRDTTAVPRFDERFVLLEPESRKQAHGGTNGTRVSVDVLYK